MRRPTEPATDLLVVAPFALGHDRGSPLRARRLLATARELGLVVRVAAFAGLPDDGATTGCRLPLPPPRHPGFSWRKLLLDVELLGRAVWLAARLQPAVIEGHVHEGLAIALAARLVSPRSRVVLNAHGALADELVAAGRLRPGGPGHRIVSRLERWLERRADTCLAQSAHRAAELRRHGVPPDRVVVCPDAPERALFSLDGVRDDAGETVCVYTGSLNAYQGIDDLLTAAAATTGVRYVVFGAPVGDYPERARRLGVADRVEFVFPAPASALPTVLARADVAVAPRRYGGNVPGKIPAYLAAGVPVVGTTVAGVAEAVPPDTGRLVPPGDPAALAAAIQDLADDPALRRRLGARAREHARAAFGPEGVRAALARCYRRKVAA